MDRVNGFHLKRCHIPLPSDRELAPPSSESNLSNPEVAVPDDSHGGSPDSEHNKHTSSDQEVAASGDFHSGPSDSLGSDDSIPLLPLPMPPLQPLQVS